MLEGQLLLLLPSSVLSPSISSEMRWSSARTGGAGILPGLWDGAGKGRLLPSKTVVIVQEKG